MFASPIPPSVRGKKWWCTVCATLLLGLGLPAHAEKLIAYTEEWPPYNFAEGKVVRGISTDLLRAACSEAKLECEVQLVPWARAYKSAREETNTLVFTTARKPARENDFLWVGPILPRTTWVYAKTGSSATAFRRREDLLTARIGIVRGEAVEQDLRLLGVPEKAFRLESDNSKVLRLLNDGLADVMIDTEVGMAWNLKAAKLPASAVTRVLKLASDGAYYFAVNPQTNPAVVEALQAAVDKLKQAGKFTAILREYDAAINAADCPANRPTPGAAVPRSKAAKSAHCPT